MDAKKESEIKQGPELIEKKLRELSTLTEINEEIHATMDMDELLQVLVEKAVIGVNFERGLIYLKEDRFLRCVAFLDRVKKERASTIKNWIGFDMDETAVEVLAAKNGETLYVADAQKDKRISQKFLKITDSREYCVVPLMGRNQVLGVLTGDKFYSQKPILAEDIKTLELFAGHISLAVENAKLYQETENFARLLEKKVHERTEELALSNENLSKRMKELSTLFEMSSLLTKSIKLETVLEHILSLVQRLGHSMCAVHLLEKGRSNVVHSIGLGKNYRQNEPLPFQKGELKKILQAIDPLLISDLKKYATASVVKKHLHKKGIQSALIVPLRSQKKLLALLIIYASQDDRFEKHQEIFFSTFAQQAGAALENAIAFQSILDQRNRMRRLSKRLEAENITLREKMKTDLNRRFIVGKSTTMNDVMDLVQKVVPTTTTVTIYGETGTGKELIANAIHEMGPRNHEALIKVNCAAIPEDLLESELFGHEKGAFTGAHERRIGMFQMAHKGTIFLDEIGDMPLKTQTKLLRTLQENEIQPLGSKVPVKVDVRVVAATNKDLQKRMKEKHFRPDLFYRLNVFPVTLPALRERREDIPELVDFFLEKYRHMRPSRVRIDPEVLDVFFEYAWPGNIRELENIIERLMIISKGDTITKQDLPRELLRIDVGDTIMMPLGEAVVDFKKQKVQQALARCGGKKSEAAAMLGMPRSNFSRLMKQLKLR
jgi:transcriptional regulator with GAF, ATPase, and Fis domain